jgi:hypothetical protein
MKPLISPRRVVVSVRVYLIGTSFDVPDLDEYFSGTNHSRRYTIKAPDSEATYDIYYKISPLSEESDTLPEGSQALILRKAPHGNRLTNMSHFDSLYVAPLIEQSVFIFYIFETII